MLLTARLGRALSRPFPMPLASQHRTGREFKGKKDITVSFKPQNTSFGFVFFFLVCYGPHMNPNLFSQGSAYGSTFHGRGLGLSTTSEQKLCNLFFCLFPKLSLLSHPR